MVSLAQLTAAVAAAAERDQFMEFGMDQDVRAVQAVLANGCSVRACSWHLQGSWRWCQNRGRHTSGPCPRLNAAQEVIILDSAVVPNGTAEVMQAHAIPSPMSHGLLESVGAKPPVQAADSAAAP